MSQGTLRQYTFFREKKLSYKVYIRQRGECVCVNIAELLDVPSFRKTEFANPNLVQMLPEKWGHAKVREVSSRDVELTALHRNGENSTEITLFLSFFFF